MSITFLLIIFFFNDTATTEIYTLSLTTLFRSGGEPTRLAEHHVARPRKGVVRVGQGSYVRSEEHTSELQSRRDLVCRLLLEKKKKKKIKSIHKKTKKKTKEKKT